MLQLSIIAIIQFHNIYREDQFDELDDSLCESSLEANSGT